MTNKNKPSVMMVAGMVIKTKIGLTTAFKNERTRATKSAHLKSKTWIPGNNSAATKTDSATIKILIM